MYCWIGSREDLTGLRVEVVLDGKSTLVESPKSVYIPAGVIHSHRYVEGDGHFVGILITEGRSYNDVTKD
jgi:2-isopropylmalate synthase